jgi:hypothetical protein
MMQRFSKGTFMLSGIQKISAINDNESLEHTGSLIIDGSVGKYAKISLRDGSLTINGSIDQETKIEIKNGSLHITGMVGANSFITLGFPTQFPNLDLKPGQIVIDESVGENVKIFAYNDIIINKNVGAGALLQSTDGNIRAERVDERALLIVSRGEIIVGEFLHQNANLFNAAGKIKDTNKLSASHSLFSRPITTIEEKASDPIPSPPRSLFPSKLAFFIAGSVAITGTAIIALRYSRRPSVG